MAGAVDLIPALRRAQAYPAPPRAEVAVVQTHISVLFFTDDRVYKVKKAVRFEFLDYSTPDRRRHFCLEEVRLNRRLAPDVYLDVVPVTRAEDGTIRFGGSGEVLDHAVVMARLPADRMLDAMLDRGEIDNRQLDDIAGLLARFHHDAESGPGVDEFGTFAGVAREVHDNFGELEPFTHGGERMPRTLSRRLCDHLHSFASGWLAGHVDVLDRRVREARIREGHGDLHAGNIWLSQNDIVIYDCIEFSRHLRCRDVACELAFLAMDLDLRCFRGFAAYLLHRYSSLTADPMLPSVAAFYKIHLAAVRGKIASLRAADRGRDANDRERARLEAMRYFHLAAAYTLPPTLILTCGLPASGKSSVARALARPFEAVILRSDVIRKELADLDPHARRSDPVDAGIYSSEFTERTQAALLDRAARQLRGGRTVVVDATLSDATQRASLVSAARACGVGFVLVETTCPESVIRERLQQRATDPNEVSDADERVYEHLKRRFEPPEEIPAAHRLQFDSRRPGEEAAAAVIECRI